MTKIDKIYTTKANLKAQNIYIKHLLKPKNTYNNTYFEAIYLVVNKLKYLSTK
jgi:hypothetical protein